MSDQKQFASREDFFALAKQRPPVEELHVPHFGKYVWVQGLSGTERDQWEESLVKGKGKKRRVDASNVRAKLAVRCIVLDPETRARMFREEDAALLGRMPAAALGPIYELAQRLSGISDEYVEELEEESSETEDSSASPSN